MLPLIRHLGVTLAQILDPLDQMSSPMEHPTDPVEPFYPCVDDVLKARYVLRWKTRPEGLPMEIVDMIIDTAEYWPSTAVSVGNVVIRQDRDRELVRTVPLCFDKEVGGLSGVYLDANTDSLSNLPLPKPSLIEHPTLAAKSSSPYRRVTRALEARRILANIMAHLLGSTRRSSIRLMKPRLRPNQSPHGVLLNRATPFSYPVFTSCNLMPGP